MYSNYLKKNIYGNDELLELFSKEIKSGHLAHAYIIEGLEGSGKYTLTKSLCADLADNERNAQLIIDGMCADIMIIGPEEGKKTIGVNTVRSIREGAFIKPTDLEFKAYIIKHADIMTVQAQNALLKLLEEPPKNVYFFLLCENSSALLPTVRSRAPVMRMQLFCNDELKKYLTEISEKKNEISRLGESELEHILCVSGGSIGMALHTLEHGDGEGAENSQTVIELLELLSLKKRAGIYLLVNSLSSKREEVIAFLQSLELAARDVIAIKQKKNNDLLFGYGEKISPFAKQLTVSQLVSCYDAAFDAREALSQNMNVTAVKTTLAGQLWKIVG